MKKKNILLILSVMAFTLASLLIFGQSPAPAKEPKQVKITFSTGSLRCQPSRGSVGFYATSAHPEAFYVSGGGEWEVRLFSAGVYYLKQTSWGSYFWQVDLIKRQVTKISEGAGLTRKPDQPLGFEVVIEKPGEMDFAINFRKMELRFEPRKKQLKLYGDNNLLSNCDTLEYCQVNPQLYHLKNRMLTGESFWKINLGTKQLVYSPGGTFCETLESENDLAWPDVKVDVKD